MDYEVICGVYLRVVFVYVVPMRVQCSHYSNAATATFNQVNTVTLFFLVFYNLTF